MKKRIFEYSVFLCIMAGFLANTNSLTLFFDAESIWGSGFGKALTDLGNQTRTAIAPGLAAGFVILIMNGQLHLWQGCLLCLSIPFFDTLFMNVFMPFLRILFMSEPASINLYAVFSNYTLFLSYTFPVFFIALVFYGISAKKHFITIPCSIWNAGWYFLLNLIPPFFPKYDFSQMGMDMGAATKRFLLYGLSYLAIILLVFFTLYDIQIHSKARTNVK